MNRLKELYSRCDELRMTPFKEWKNIKYWYDCYREEFEDFMEDYFVVFKEEE
jgi:hypothetical protein